MIQRSHYRHPGPPWGPGSMPKNPTLEKLIDTNRTLVDEVKALREEKRRREVDHG